MVIAAFLLGLTLTHTERPGMDSLEAYKKLLAALGEKN